MNLVSIYDQEKLRAHGLLAKPATLRVWRCRGKYPELFVRFAHKLMVDLDVLERIIKEEKEKQRQEARNFKRVKN